MRSVPKAGDVAYHTVAAVTVALVLQAEAICDCDSSYYIAGPLQAPCRGMCWWWELGCVRVFCLFCFVVFVCWCVRWWWDVCVWGCTCALE